MLTKECDNCDSEFEYRDRENPPELCESCAEAKGFAAIEAPEGGIRRGSDLDRI